VRCGDAARYSALSAAALVAALAGLVTSSVVSLSLWLAFRLTGDGHAIGVLGASVGVVAWICFLFGVGVASWSGPFSRVTKTEGSVLAVAFFGPLVTGILVRKYLQLLHPNVLPPPEAYAQVVLPTAVMLGVVWLTAGRRLASRVRKRGAEP
jgi:hypothetical protein